MSNKLFLSIDELPIVFHDLTPVPQNDTIGAAARIDYTQDFITAYDYQRAVWNANETNTQRALQLTAVCLRLNPANYTVWHFRRLCLEQIYISSNDWSFLKDEMYLSSVLGGDNPKNYQIWYHRRALLEKLLTTSTNSLSGNLKHNYDTELDYIANVLNDDSKNYHAWSHRQWVVSSVAKSNNGEEIWKMETDFTDSLIQKDHRNNSAWNQRWFVFHRGQHDNTLEEEVATKECEYALSIAQLDPYNESPWRYLIALLKEQIFSLEDADKVMSLLHAYYMKIKTIEQTFLSEPTESKCIPNLTSALIDILEWKGDKSSVEEAVNLAKDLANEYDMIRCKYWNLRISKLELKM